MYKTRECQRCRDTLIFADKFGWVHESTGLLEIACAPPIRVWDNPFRPLHRVD